MSYPAARPVHLTPPVRRKLQRLSRAQSAEHRSVVRAQIILRASQGMSNVAIARDLGCNVKTVRKWRERFKERPSDKALVDQPRSGRPQCVPTTVRCELLKLACQRPDGNSMPFQTIWTTASLGLALERETGYHLSQTEIRRILNGADIHPHRIKMWLHSPDPQFREKVKVICDLYCRRRQPGVKILCIDEKTGMQALEHRFPLHLAESGRSGRLEFEYKRHGTRTLIAALDVVNGKVFGECLAGRTEQDLMGFMEDLAQRHSKGDIYVIWDNLNIHHGPRWVDFNRRHGGRFHFIWTPLHASWVNQIEIWFSLLERRVLRHADFRSVFELSSTIDQFIEQWNVNEAHPFNWRFRGRWQRSRHAPRKAS